MPNKWLTLEERLWPKVEKTETCWLWTGSVNDYGYGAIHAKGRRTGVHRAVYELLVGPIPEGFQIDHLCRVRNCVNPAHLEPVTQRENLRRGRAGAHYGERTHCKNGHPFDESNTTVRIDRANGTPVRVCLQCHRDASCRYRARQRASSAEPEERSW